MNATPPILLPEVLRARFGERVRFNAPLAPYTASRIGGPAEVLLPVDDVEQLASGARILWDEGIPFTVLGGGSNVLVSDRGMAGVVILNRARSIRFEHAGTQAAVQADSGANFGSLARKAAARSLGGLEWAAGIPGTVGGAVVGNAGAHGGDISGNLDWAEILSRREERRRWDEPELRYEYRSSVLKKSPGEYLVLSARLYLKPRKQASIKEEMDRYLAHRRRTQPPGASMGSMFKNPPGDYAGRLIEEAGLKGARHGGAAISDLHGNFFINQGSASAADVLALINKSREAVAERFGVKLELEIEFLGDWEGESLPVQDHHGE